MLGCKDTPLGSFLQRLQFERNQNGHPAAFLFDPPYCIVGMRDCAILLAGALLASDVDHCRVATIGAPIIGFNNVLQIWREAFLDHKVAQDIVEKPIPKAIFAVGDDQLCHLLIKRHANHDCLSVQETVIDSECQGREMGMTIGK